MLNNTLKVVLTGTIGSGKTTAAKYFSELGVPVIDSDEIVQSLLLKQEVKRAIIEHFGAEVVSELGELHRRKIREIIFNDLFAKEWLENFLHPLVFKEITSRLQNIEVEYCVIVIPLFLETRGQFPIADRVLVIDTPREQQIARAMERDKMPEALAQKILVQQSEREKLFACADDIIINDKDIFQLKKQVESLHRKYQNTAKELLRSRGVRKMELNQLLVYELPLNESSRVCVRLERLFRQIEHHLSQSTVWDAQFALFGILDVLEIMARPGLVGLFIKSLQHYATSLSRLLHSQDVDKEKLETVLSQVDNLIDILHHSRGKLGQDLRQNEFIQLVRQYVIPGGICEFSVPAFSLWLQQPAEVKKENLLSWFGEFETLYAVVATLLKMARGSSSPQEKIAINGFYQESLVSNLVYQIIQVSIPQEFSAYPEISVGRHRLSIYFSKLNPNGSMSQIEADIQFKLALFK